jgi:amidase
VFGHKPTWTIVPPAGQALPGMVSVPDIAVVGPMARSADDLDIALAAVAGPDAIDGTGVSLRLPAPQRKRLRDFRVAIMLSAPESDVDVEVQDRLHALAEFLGTQRAKVSDRARPAIDTGEAFRVYITLLRSATCGRLTPAQFEEHLDVAQRLPAGDQSYYALMVRANTMSHKDWLVANEARHRMRLRWAEFFRDWDVLLCPAAASAAFPHDHEGERHERTVVVNGRRVPTTDQMFWAGYPCMAYLPSTVAPCGFTPSGLPVGVQIVAPQYGDRTAIHFARLLEREFQPFVPPPGYE